MMIIIAQEETEAVTVEVHVAEEAAAAQVLQGDGVVDATVIGIKFLKDKL